MCQYTADGTQLKGCEGIFGVLGKEKADPCLRVGFQPGTVPLDLGLRHGLVDRRRIVDGMLEFFPISQGVAVYLLHRFVILALMKASNNRVNSWAFSKSIGRMKSTNAAPTPTIS